MRIKSEIVIAVSSASWAAWAGIDTADARADVIEYLTSHVPDLPGFCQTDAVIRLRLRGTPATEPDRRRDVDRWSTFRDGE